MPTEEHPEEMVAVGNVLLVLCFDPRDPVGDWYLDYLRNHHHVRIANRCPALNDLEAALSRSNSITPLQKAPIFAGYETALLQCSMGALRVGELAWALKDWPRAETAFRRALALDAQGDALTRVGSQFSAYYGLGLAISSLGRARESIAIFEQALDLARLDKNPRFEGWAAFNLACARAESGQFPAAAEALREAIAIDPSHKIRARTDRSFQNARSLPAFKHLLQ